MTRTMNCNYPKCKAEATDTWALVELCAEHREAIRKETAEYYGKPSRTAPEEEQRWQYMEICDQIPWSKQRLRVGERK